MYKEFDPSAVYGLMYLSQCFILGTPLVYKNKTLLQRAKSLGFIMRGKSFASRRRGRPLRSPKVDGGVGFVSLCCRFVRFLVASLA